MSQVKSVTHPSNEDQAVYDIHDISKSYYKIALKRFIDNVVVQAVERYYFGPGGPVNQITLEYIGEFSDEDLDEVAHETYETARTRNDINSRLKRLEEVLKISEETFQRHDSFAVDVVSMWVRTLVNDFLRSL